MRAWHSLSHCLVVLCHWYGFRNGAECVSEDFARTEIKQFPTPTFYFNLPLKRAKLRVTVLCWVAQGGCGKNGKTQIFPFPAPWRALNSPFPSLTQRSFPCFPLLLALLALCCFMRFFKPKPNQSQLCLPQKNHSFCLVHQSFACKRNCSLELGCCCCCFLCKHDIFCSVWIQICQFPFRESRNQVLCPDFMVWMLPLTHKWRLCW